jgi:peptidoglycan-N-acetylmuramic acid deacetylase
MQKQNIFKKVIAGAAVFCLAFAGCARQGGEDLQSTTNKAEESTTNVAETTLEASGVRLDIKDYSSEPITWGPGNIKDHKRPTDPENLQNKFAELNAQWLLPQEKTICLTFDEGYENGFTAQILDTLAQKNIKAIFFCTYDYVKDNPTLVSRMINEGHIVGNHSYRHLNMTQVDLETASDEITMMHDYMAQMFQYEMKYFRFPEGAFSEQTIALAADLGYRSVFWSFAYADWDKDKQPNEKEAYDRIISSTHDGEIMLLHAVSSTNADILGAVIDDIQNQGYTFTTEL